MSFEDFMNSGVADPRSANPLRALGNVIDDRWDYADAQKLAQDYITNRDEIRTLQGAADAQATKDSAVKSAELGMMLTSLSGVGTTHARNKAELGVARDLDIRKAMLEAAGLTSAADREKWGANYSLKTLPRDQGFADRNWDSEDRSLGIDRETLGREHGDRMWRIKQDHSVGNWFMPSHGKHRKSEQGAFSEDGRRLDERGVKNRLGRDVDNAGLVDRREKSTADIRFANSDAARAAGFAQIAQEIANNEYRQANHNIDADALRALTEWQSKFPDATRQEIIAAYTNLGIPLPPELQPPQVTNTGVSQNGVNYTLGSFS
jgi:hypothetical protein